MFSDFYVWKLESCCCILILSLVTSIPVPRGVPSICSVQPCAYKDKKPILKALRRLYRDGKLDRDQLLIFAKKRPIEELYDLKNDPHELHNLAADPAHRQTLLKLQTTLMNGSSEPVTWGGKQNRWQCTTAI